MKNALKLFVLLVTISLMTFSCKKNDKNNSFMKIGDNLYELSGGTLVNYGNYGSSYNLDLTLFSSNIQYNEVSRYHTGSGQMIYFELFTSDATGLDTRDYTFAADETETAGTFYDAYLVTDYYYDYGIGNYTYINSGTLTVNKSGDEYEIEFEGTDAGGKTVKASYKGKIPVYNIGSYKKQPEDNEKRK